MPVPTAHQFADLLHFLGLDLGSLGCIMLDVDPMPGIGRVCRAAGVKLHKSSHPDRWWIDGAVGEDGPAHVTLFYGHLEPDVVSDSNAVYRAAVDEVLAGWRKPAVLDIDHVGWFPSPYPDEPYWCLVAELTMHPALREAHQLLSYLPHIDTHPEYRPHITLAYVTGTEEARDRAIDLLDMEIGVPVVRGLSYGDRSAR